MERDKRVVQEDEEEEWQQQEEKEQQLDNVCSICLKLVPSGESDQAVVKFLCHHKFHLDCIGTALNLKNSMACPNCRQVQEGRRILKKGARSSRGPEVPNAAAHNNSGIVWPKRHQWYPFHLFQHVDGLLSDEASQNARNSGHHPAQAPTAPHMYAGGMVLNAQDNRIINLPLPPPRLSNVPPVPLGAFPDVESPWWAPFTGYQYQYQQSLRAAAAGGPMAPTLIPMRVPANQGAAVNSGSQDIPNPGMPPATAAAAGTPMLPNFFPGQVPTNRGGPANNCAQDMTNLALPPSINPE